MNFLVQFNAIRISEKYRRSAEKYQNENRMVEFCFVKRFFFKINLFSGYTLAPAVNREPGDRRGTDEAASSFETKIFKKKK